LGEDPAPPFVPLHPRTAEDRERLEALREFAAARALEDRRDFRGAISLLEAALQKQPDSVAILRRLSRLCFALGRVEQAVGYSRRVVEAEPEDTQTLTLLVAYYLQKNDPAGAEALLKSVRENPKLAQSSIGRLLIERDLGELYADRLQQPEKAAEAYAKVVAALEDQAHPLSADDRKTLLNGDEPDAYLRFGEVFLQAKQFDRAIHAFRKGLEADPDHPLLPRYLAQALLRAGKPAEALDVLEPFLRRQPPGREPYELLAEILTALKRTDEITPRLEAAAKADPKNLPLQYTLADRYRETGQADKAEALYRELLASQPDPQGYGALAASLRQEKKFEELIKLLGEAVETRKAETIEAVRPQIESISNDPAATEQILAAGLKLQQADPPKLSRSARLVLAQIATKAKRLDLFVPIQRLALKREPNPLAYLEFYADLSQAGNHEEAGAVLAEMLAKYPNEKTAERLTALAQTWLMAGQANRSLEAAREALKLDANDAGAMLLVAAALARLNRNEEALAQYKAILDRFPNDDRIVKFARSGLSTVYVNMEQFDKGEAELEQLLQKEPDDPGLNNDLGYLYADQGKNLEKAEAMIRKAVEEEPENHAYLDSLGWVLFKRGKLKEAVEPLEKAAQNPEADATILDHLGDVYFQLKDYNKARTAWEKAEQRASRSTPPDKRLPEIRKKLDALSQLEPPPDPKTGRNP
ncbi:MAG: tetratricopeptide repeat protein, partial [Isosphaeraceae bacterium]|nr:tetratricopeptide repeat protein [Isosphaeraceae bacterium]